MAKFRDDLLFKEECFKIIGICMKIHSKLGPGFREIVYKDAMEIEFVNDPIPYEREKPFPIMYEGFVLKHSFDADYFVFNSIVIEVKAIPQLRTDDFRQTMNYLKASKVKLGLLINFGESKLRFHRIICTYPQE